jgi:hypothetical protein
VPKDPFDLCALRELLIFTVKVAGIPQNSQDEGPPLLACPLLFTQHLLSYHPDLEAVSSRPAVVTRDMLNIGNSGMPLKMKFDPLLSH